MAKKKTLYEILEVSPDATYPEIRAAHDARLQALEARRAALGRDDYNMELSVLKVAYNTLSTPSSRDAYDVKLKFPEEPSRSSALLVVPPTDAAAAAALRADAMLLRAEALALRADAMGLKADVGSGLPVVQEETPAKLVTRSAIQALRTILLVLGSLAAGIVILRLIFFSMGAAPLEDTSPAAAQAAEKAYLQEYFQTHGVRPANRAEAALLDAERRKKEDEARAQRAREAELYKAQQADERFEEQARRRGEQVARDLERAEESARRAREAEEQRKEEQRLMREEAELRRREAEQERWRRALGQ